MRLILIRPILLCSLTFLSFNLQASEDLNVDPLTTVKISKDDILKSLELLKSQNKISESDYQKSKKELMLMSDSQITSMKETAIGVVRNNPDMAEKLIKADKIDSTEVKKQIDALSRPAD